MKPLLILLLTFYGCLAFGQTGAQIFRNKQLHNKNLSPVEMEPQLNHFDFSKLFTKTDNSMVYGFIGDDFQRLRVKLITVTKSEVAGKYDVYGKSMVKGTICEFNGAITISNIRKFKTTSLGVDDMYKNTGIKGEYIIVGDYLFSENPKQNHAGVFKGVVVSKFYIDKNNNVKYDDIDMQSDGYSNNQFTGTWSSNKNKLVEKCNWGDFRIPNSGDFDGGAGEFSPMGKFVKNGWQTVADMAVQNAKSKNAKIIEDAKWWR
jgi:hypothetical protein